MLIDDEWADHLVRGARSVLVSVNAATKETHEKVNIGSDFNRVIENIERLVKKKRSIDAAVSIVFRYTIVPENIHEAVKAIELADSLGCDSIAYGYSDTVRPFLQANRELLIKVRNDLAQLVNSRDLKVGIDYEHLAHLGIK